MFSGIIEQLGQVVELRKKGKLFRLKIATKEVIRDLKIGDSVSVNGVCLTLVAQNAQFLEFDVLNETATKTNLGILKIGERVNLERALKTGDRISGHFVNGHVDCLGIIRKKIYKNDNLLINISFPDKFTKLVVNKGSIAVDGISLTIVENYSNTFGIYIIPHTLKNTTLNFKGPSNTVNLEFDILAKINLPR